MFESFIDFEKTVLIDLVSTGKRFVYLTDILNNHEVKSYYKTFFNAEVEWWIYEEQIQRNTNTNFDYEEETLKLTLNKLDEYLLKAARFDKSALKVTVDSAVNTYLNYLVRPRTTLKWFVFRGEPTKPFHEILKRMNYLEEYEYILTGFIDYINENNIIRNYTDIFSVIEFERIIEKVDNDYIMGVIPEDFVKITEPLFAFFNTGKQIDEYSKIPIEALIVFLDDKGVEPLVNIFKSQLMELNKGFVNQKEYLEEIYNLLRELDTNPMLNEQQSSIHEFENVIIPENSFDEKSNEDESATEPIQQSEIEADDISTISNNAEELEPEDLSDEINLTEEESMELLTEGLNDFSELSALIDSSFPEIHGVTSDMIADMENTANKVESEDTTNIKSETDEINNDEN